MFLLPCPLGTLARAEGFCLNLCQALDGLEAAWKESLKLKSQKCIFGKCVVIGLPFRLHVSVTAAGGNYSLVLMTRYFVARLGASLQQWT